jgi:hypothetical protein
MFLYHASCFWCGWWQRDREDLNCERFWEGKISGTPDAVNDERDGVRCQDDADTCTTLHWHSSEVKFLKFASGGAYLFSGFAY